MESFSLEIKVINGQVQEFASEFNFRCDEIIPIGPDIVSYFDEAMCSVAMKIFYIKYGGELFGSTQFKTMDEFQRYWTRNCIRNRVYLLINGCRMQMNGKNVSII